MRPRHRYWPVILCACLATSGSHAFSPLGDVRQPLVRVSNSTGTAPVERLRTIPENALRGDMWPPQGRRVRINDTVMVLAPGATIRDMNNRMVLPNTLRRPKKIRYTLDMYGQINRIWISPTGGSGRHRPLPPTPHE